jgi:hypothetical protein
VDSFIDLPQASFLNHYGLRGQEARHLGRILRAKGTCVVNEVNNKVAGSSVSEFDDSTRASKFEIRLERDWKDKAQGKMLCPLWACAMREIFIKALAGEDALHKMLTQMLT